MIKNLRETSIGAIFILLFSGLMVHFHLFLQPIKVIAQGSGILPFLLQKYLVNLNPVINTILYFFLIFSQAIKLNLVLNENKMFAKVGFTTAFAYLLLTGIIIEWSSLNAAIISNSLLIWIFVKIIKLYNNNQSKTILFNIGLLSAFAFCLYPPTGFLFFIALCSYLVMRPFKLTEIFILLIGICSVFYIIISLAFLTNSLSNLTSLIPSWGIEFAINNKQLLIFYINCITVLILFLLGLIYWLPSTNRMVIQSRKNWGVLLLFLTLFFPLFFWLNHSSITVFCLLIMPLAAFTSNFFLNSKKVFFVNCIVLVIAGIIAYNNWLLLQ